MGCQSRGCQSRDPFGGRIERRPRAVESHFHRGLQGSGMFLDEPQSGKREKPRVAGPFPRALGDGEVTQQAVAVGSRWAGGGASF